MTEVTICIAANEFSAALARCWTKGKVLVYVSYRQQRTKRLFQLASLILYSWFLRIHPKVRTSLMIPHTFGSFGIIKKLLHFDDLIIFEDGISLLSIKEFQKKHIISEFSDKKFRKLLTCDQDIAPLPLPNFCVLKLDRGNVVSEMIRSAPAIEELTEESVILVDNGLWSRHELSIITHRIYNITGQDPIVIAHPMRRSLPTSNIKKLNVPTEVMLIKNNNKIRSIFGSFSTSILNYSAVYGFTKVYFLRDYCESHLDRLKQTAAQIV